MYQFYKIRPKQEEPQMIVRLFDNAFIPVDEANSDYVAYLAWVAEGNTAEEWTGN